MIAHPNTRWSPLLVFVLGAMSFAANAAADDVDIAATTEAPGVADVALPAAVLPAPPPVPSATPTPAAPGPLRIAVVELQLDGVEPRQGRVVMGALLAELRKLQRVSVVGMDEIRAMLDHESNKQLVGCSEETCLSDVADALGVDILVLGSLSTVGEENIFGLRRLDQRTAKVTGGVNRRFRAGNGEEFLASIGPAVAELFADVPLRPGLQRGVAQEMALRLNPPPLPTWVFWTEVGLTAGLGVAAGVTAAMNAQANAAVADYQVEHRLDFDNGVFEEKADYADATAWAFYGAAGAGAGMLLASLVSAMFTDFAGYAAMNEPAAP